MNDPIIRRIHACVLASVPVCLWGPPGSGKTARVKAYALARKSHLERWLLSRCEPIDLKPRVYDGGRVIVADPPEIVRLQEAGGGILFVDELNRSARETEGAALDRIDSPPPGVAVIAACNPPTRGQAARSLESAAANRFCHLDVDVNQEAFADALISGWGLAPADMTVPSDDAIDAESAKATAIMSAFIRRAVKKLEDEPENPVQAGRAWPSPRTWDYALRLYSTGRALGLDVEDTTALLGGAVGNGAAVEFLSFAADMVGLPDPEAWLKDPKSWHPPKGRVDKTIAAVTMVAGALARNRTQDRWKQTWAIVQACVDADQTDAGMVMGTMLMNDYTSQGKAAGMPFPAKWMPSRIAALIGKAKP
jgi:MoxR-like ATPase